jgi:hypothetical protein
MITEILNDLQDASVDLFQLIASCNQEQINTVPFENSWTPAQVAEHITRSNKAIAQALGMAGKATKRNPIEGAQKLKAMFLDFTVKLQSPEFILPTQDYYQKETLMEELKKSTQNLNELASKVNLSEEINLHPFGEITKIELLHFVLYHTKRHIHQVKNILLLRREIQY